MPQARYEIDGDVAEIVISNPPLNLWGPSLITDIEDGVARAAAERPRALIVRADGDVFSAGVDVHVFEGVDRQSVVHGLCLTAGLELSLACDLMWAADGAQFGLVEKVVGSC
jgi:enoyl-CoA hydratase